MRKPVFLTCLLGALAATACGQATPARVTQSSLLPAAVVAVSHSGVASALPITRVEVEAVEAAPARPEFITNVVGILRQPGDQGAYELVDAKVTLSSAAGGPTARFQQADVIFDGGNYPQTSRSFPVDMTLPGGGQVTARVPLVSTYAEELIAAGFNGTAPPGAAPSSARVFLRGVDANNHNLIVEFATQLHFIQMPNGPTGPPISR